MNFELFAIVPEKISEARIRGLVLATLQKYEKKILKDLEKTAATFVTDPVEFETKVSYSGGEAIMAAWTDNEIWGYLNEGTDERWAIMNNPFNAKTKVRDFNSGAGSRTYNEEGYYTRIRGRGAMQKLHLPPMPGIEARLWTDMLEDLYEDDFADDIAEALLGGFG